MKNLFDELNSVIKSTSAIHDIYHHVMRTLAIKMNMQKEPVCFNMYFSLWKIYNNNKAKSENTMILCVQ